MQSLWGKMSWAPQTNGLHEQSQARHFPPSSWSEKRISPSFPFVKNDLSEKIKWFAYRPFWLLFHSNATALQLKLALRGISVPELYSFCSEEEQ